MDPKALTGAWTEFDRAAESLAALKQAKEFERIERHWSAFLTSVGRVFTKLEQGAESSGKSQAWWGRQTEQRRSDPLLCYLRHARNVDEHTLQMISELVSGSVKAVESTADDRAALQSALNNSRVPFVPLGLFEWRPESVRLLPVKDRGVLYPPPLVHLDAEIASTSPAHIGNLALKFLDEMLRHAEMLSPGYPSRPPTNFADIIAKELKAATTLDISRSYRAIFLAPGRQNEMHTIGCGSDAAAIEIAQGMADRSMSDVELREGDRLVAVLRVAALPDS